MEGSGIGEVDGRDERRCHRCNWREQGVAEMKWGLTEYRDDEVAMSHATMKRCERRSTRTKERLDEQEKIMFLSASEHARRYRKTTVT